MTKHAQPLRVVDGGGRTRKGRVAEPRKDKEGRVAWKGSEGQGKAGL